MSVYASIIHFSNDFGEEGKNKVYVYEGSHVVPDENKLNPKAYLDVAYIPNHILAYRENPKHPNVERDEELLQKYKSNFLRIIVGSNEENSGSVILTEQGAKELKEALEMWLNEKILY